MPNGRHDKRGLQLDEVVDAGTNRLVPPGPNLAAWTELFFAMERRVPDALTTLAEIARLGTIIPAAFGERLDVPTEDALYGWAVGWGIPWSADADEVAHLARMGKVTPDLLEAVRAQLLQKGITVKAQLLENGITAADVVAWAIETFQTLNDPEQPDRYISCLASPSVTRWCMQQVRTHVALWRKDQSTIGRWWFFGSGYREHPPPKYDPLGDETFDEYAERVTQFAAAPPGFTLVRGTFHRGNFDAFVLEAGPYDATRGEAELTMRTVKSRDGEKPPDLHCIRRRVTLNEADRRGQPVTSCVIESDGRTREDREAEATAAVEREHHELDLRTLRVLAEHPDASTSQDKLRVRLGVKRDVAYGALSRVVQRGWAREPERQRQPYILTDAGRHALNGAPS